MDDLDKVIILEKYVDNLDYYYSQIKMLCKFINIHNMDIRKEMNETLAITKNKIKKLKKCKVLEDYKKYVDVDEVIKAYAKKVLR